MKEVYDIEMMKQNDKYVPNKLNNQYNEAYNEYTYAPNTTHDPAFEEYLANLNTPIKPKTSFFKDFVVGFFQGLFLGSLFDMIGHGGFMILPIFINKDKE